MPLDCAVSTSVTVWPALAVVAAVATALRVWTTGWIATLTVVAAVLQLLSVTSSLKVRTVDVVTVGATNVAVACVGLARVTAGPAVWLHWYEVTVPLEYAPRPPARRFARR